MILNGQTGVDAATGEGNLAYGGVRGLKEQEVQSTIDYAWGLSREAVLREEQK